MMVIRMMGSELLAYQYNRYEMFQDQQDTIWRMKAMHRKAVSCASVAV
jgi:hypothetical protein